MAQNAVSGKPLQPMSVRTSAWAVYDIFDTADGQQLFVGVVSDTQWRLFCEAFGLAAFAADRGLDSNAARVARREEIMPVIRARFREIAKQELMQTLEHTGLPFAPIARPEDLFDDPQMNAGGLVEVTLADGRSTRLPAMPVAFGEQRMGLRHDLPAAGQDARQILAECGYDGPGVDQLFRDGAVSGE